MTNPRPNFQSRRRRREQRSGSSYYDPLLDLLVTTDDPASTAIMHEWIHFLDHISTSYGCLLDQIVNVTARGWGELLNEARTNRAYIPVPFDRLLLGGFNLEEFGAREEHQQSTFDRVIAGAITHDLLAGLVDAMQGNDPEMLTGAPAVSGLAALERMMEVGEALPASADALEGLPTWQRPEHLVPQVSWGREVADQRTGIGARALLEGRAMIVESALVNSSKQHFMRALEVGSPEYVVAIDIAAQEVAALGKHAESFGFSTFLALSDLALMTPAAPAFSRLRTERLWTQVHPGYRFVDLLDLIPKVGHYDRQEDPFEYQAKFCRLLKWPDPREVLEHGAQLEGDDYRTVRRREAFQLKLDSPELFFVGRMPEDTNALVTLLSEFQPNTCIQLDATTLRATNEIDQNNVEEFILRLGYAYLFDLGERLMQCDDPLGVAVDWIEAYEDRFDLGNERSLRRFFDGNYTAGVEFRTVKATSMNQPL